MATSKLIFQLVNYEKQNPLDIQFGDGDPEQGDWRYCDWDLDGNGALKTITKQEAVVQGSLKCIFTEKQDNGYGTTVYDLIGEKDVIVRRVGLFLDITMGIMAMKSFIDAQAVAQNLSPDDMIATMSKLTVVDDDTNPSISRVQMALKSNSDVQTTIGVL